MLSLPVLAFEPQFLEQELSDGPLARGLSLGLPPLLLKDAFSLALGGLWLRRVFSFSFLVEVRICS